MILGIEHIAIFAKDTASLSEWYAKNLNGEIVYDNGKGTYFVAFENKSMIEFCKSDSENAPTSLETAGIRHIAITTNDFENDVLKIKSTGVEIIKEATVSAKGIGTMFFRDPEGNILHFISRVEPLI